MGKLPPPQPVRHGVKVSEDEELHPLLKLAILLGLAVSAWGGMIGVLYLAWCWLGAKA